MGLTLGPEYGGPLSVAMCSEDEADGEATLFPFRATNDDGTNADACFRVRVRYERYEVRCYVR